MDFNSSNWPQQFLQEHALALLPCLRGDSLYNIWQVHSVREVVNRILHEEHGFYELSDVQNLSSVVMTAWFEKPLPGQVYYRLKDETKEAILMATESDPIWYEHFELVDYIKKNLYDTPFMVKCDDYDFVLGALNVAINELGERDRFDDWWIREDSPDYFEIDSIED